MKRRPHWRNETEQAWIDMENHHYPNEKRQMKSKRKRVQTQFSLCNEVKEPVDTLSAYVIWLYGPAGYGKTSLSAMFPQSHLFCVHGQAKALKARYVNLQSWEQFKQLIDQFKQSDFKTATLDLVESVYDMCFESECEKLGIDYPGKTESGKDDYGKSWFFIRKEFSATISKLMTLEDDQGLVLISNSIYSERKTEEGSVVEDIHPNLSARPLNLIAGAVDIIGYYAMNTKNERELLIRPKQGVMAKCRIDNRFRYTDGSPIENIPMGKNKEEAFNNFIAAFENRIDPPVKERTTKRVKRTSKKR